ncbi:hypothetical protein H6G04_27045 [Calothrix membranacea FACHB-236]|nr:hypothetical protein [Calothrix membranacea FACHB-236]
MRQNNAARRLYDAFQYALADGNPNEFTYLVLARAFGVKDPESNKYFLIDIFDLLAEVEKKIKLLKNVDGIEIYVKGIQEIQYYLITCNPLDGLWQTLKSFIEGRNLSLILHSCANFLDQEQPEPELTDEQLHEYLKQCESLLQEVVISDLSNDIKEYLVVRLEEICSAIRHYKIGGPERLRIIVEASIGAAVVRYGQYSEQQKEGIFKKIMNVLGPIATVLGLVADTNGFVLPAVKEVVKNLPLPSNNK